MPLNLIFFEIKLFYILHYHLIMNLLHSAMCHQSSILYDFSYHLDARKNVEFALFHYLLHTSKPQTI
jgi:hypothetical protein